jgi:hypothetical protein
LLDAVRTRLRTRHHSRRTEESYVKSPGFSWPASVLDTDRGSITRRRSLAAIRSAARAEEPMVKWIAGVLGAAVMAVVTAWALHCFGPPDKPDRSHPGRPEAVKPEPRSYRPPISFVTAKVWREGGISNEGIKGDVSRTCSGSKCEGTVNIGGYFPGLPKSLEIKFRCGSEPTQSESFPESPRSGRVTYKVECALVQP